MFDVGARIKELRMAQSLSTNKLSNLAGLSQSYVRKLEKGECRPTIETVELLCHALVVTFDDFVNYKDFSLHQLRAIKIIRELNDEQLEGFCKLMDHNSSNA